MERTTDTTTTWSWIALIGLVGLIIGVVTAVLPNFSTSFIQLSWLWVLLGIAALIGVILILLKPWIGYLFLIISLPFRSFSLPISGSFHLRISELIFLLVFTAFWLRLVVRKETRIKMTSLEIPLLLFYLWMIASFLWSESLSLALLQSSRVLFGMLLFFLSVQIIDSDERLKHAMNTWVYAGGIIAGVGIYEFISRGLPYLKENLAQAPTVYTQGLRSSVFLSPTLLSSYLNLSIFFAIARMMQTRDKKYRILLASAIALLLAAQIFTFSRGGWAGLAFGILYFAYKTHALHKLIIIILVFMLLLLIFAGGMVFDIITTRIASFAQPQEDIAFQQRILLWQATQHMILDHPLKGIGIGNSELKYEELSSLYPTRFRYTHSLYLNLLAELGIVGLCLFLLICLGVLKITFNANRTAGDETQKKLLWACSGGYISYLVHGVVHFHLAERHIWMYLGIATAVYVLLRNNIEKAAIGLEEA